MPDSSTCIYLYIALCIYVCLPENYSSDCPLFGCSCIKNHEELDNTRPLFNSIQWLPEWMTRPKKIHSQHTHTHKHTQFLSLKQTNKCSNAITSAIGSYSHTTNVLPAPGTQTYNLSRNFLQSETPVPRHRNASHHAALLLTNHYFKKIN
jgi:hypothetical protein